MATRSITAITGDTPSSFLQLYLIRILSSSRNHKLDQGTCIIYTLGYLNILPRISNSGLKVQKEVLKEKR
jgi:hypothetical protein